MRLHLKNPFGLLAVLCFTLSLSAFIWGLSAPVLNGRPLFAGFVVLGLAFLGAHFAELARRN